MWSTSTTILQSNGLNIMGMLTCSLMCSIPTLRQCTAISRHLFHNGIFETPRTLSIQHPREMDTTRLSPVFSVQERSRIAYLVLMVWSLTQLSSVLNV